MAWSCIHFPWLWVSDGFISLSSSFVDFGVSVLDEVCSQFFLTDFGCIPLLFSTPLVILSNLSIILVSAQTFLCLFYLLILKPTLVLLSPSAELWMKLFFCPRLSSSRKSVEATAFPAQKVKKVQIRFKTIAEFSSFAQTILSTTEKSGEELSENEVRRSPIAESNCRTTHLFRSFFLGTEAREKQVYNLSEYADLFAKTKANIGGCKIAKHRIELTLEAVPHCEILRRISPFRAAKSNQEFLSYPPWASGTVMVKKELRPLNDVTVKDAFPLPRKDENISRIANLKIFTSTDYAWALPFGN